jgi:hypothetical protein
MPAVFLDSGLDGMPGLYSVHLPRLLYVLMSRKKRWLSVLVSMGNWILWYLGSSVSLSPFPIPVARSCVLIVMKPDVDLIGSSAEGSVFEDPM